MAINTIIGVPTGVLTGSDVKKLFEYPPLSSHGIQTRKRTHELTAANTSKALKHCTSRIAHTLA
jgi:hypothetical protein